jgi:hypothetical protein
MIAFSVASAVAVFVSVAVVVELPAAVFEVVELRALPSVLRMLLVVVASLCGLSSYSLTRTSGARGAKMSEKVRGVGVITAIT